MKEKERMFELGNGDEIIIYNNLITRVMYLDKETISNNKCWNYYVKYKKLIRDKRHYGGWNGQNISESVKGYMTREEWELKLKELSSVEKAVELLDKLDDAIESVACSGRKEDYKKYEFHYFS